MQTPFKLIIDAYACSEFGDGPAYAELTVYQVFFDRLRELSWLCKERGLESVSVPAGPDYWDNEDDLRIRGNSLVVTDDSFWFSAYPKHADYAVETRAIDIETFIQIATEGPAFTSDSPLAECFEWHNGKLYFCGDTGLLPDLIDMVEAKEEEA